MRKAFAKNLCLKNAHRDGISGEVNIGLEYRRLLCINGKAQSAF